MSLEEYEPNQEFVGRNFNAGEVIQLVLKAPGSGHWLPFRHVQMVMMHELAHCEQMNHSGVFWKVRNRYAGELRALWERGYTGDGMWGKGRMLAIGAQDGGTHVDQEIMPAALCGGTYRSTRNKKRKRKSELHEKPKLSYAERQQRRIRRKFGTKGTLLGEDEDAISRLENGKKPKGKPRVAGSARGRELRAAAALARLTSPRTKMATKEAQLIDSDSDSDYEDMPMKAEPALDLSGKAMLDDRGRGLVRVCEVEDEASDDVKQEMQELQELDCIASAPHHTSDSSNNKETADSLRGVSIRRPQSSTRPSKSPPHSNGGIGKNATSTTFNDWTSSACPICSFSNTTSALACAICAHVLSEDLISDHWSCGSVTCKGSAYLNAGDCGVCGICGQKR
ncbi:MAG: hypothetical protein M1824_002866 [Vezdaea acicularis]|nr:MAG: hypothetical protein M1824_002866 [Vezdaea acicularis]